MYHQQTADHAPARRSAAAILIALALCACLAVFVSGFAQSAIREQSAISLRSAILDSAKQCCAIEGAYPTSLAYLKDHYGLVVNEKDYLITYECYADNVMPSVVVVPR